MNRELDALEFLDVSELGEPIGIHPSLRGEMEFTIEFDASKKFSIDPEIAKKLLDKPTLKGID